MISTQSKTNKILDQPPRTSITEGTTDKNTIEEKNKLSMI